ncbi:MAG: HAD family phosphatase [Dehalococcoidia bacterium]|jgi:beta-phosphoglucomutase family hydrolase
MPELKAVIWDMDGVLADTASFHFGAWRETFSRRGIAFSNEDFMRGFGIRNDAIIRNMLGTETTQDAIDTIAKEKEATFRRLIGGQVKPLPGVPGLLGQLHDKGIKMAIASSTVLDNIRLIVASLDIEKYFDAVVTGHDVTRGKPHPQVFLKAAQRLETPPRNCLVFEDAVAGVQAAKRAGMRCVAVTTSHPRESLGEADLIVDSLEEVTVVDLEKLLKSNG